MPYNLGNLKNGSEFSELHISEASRDGHFASKLDPTVDDINPAVPYLRDCRNHGRFLIMGNAGFVSSTVSPIPVRMETLYVKLLWPRAGDEKRIVWGDHQGLVTFLTLGFSV